MCVKKRGFRHGSAPVRTTKATRDQLYSSFGVGSHARRGSDLNAGQVLRCENPSVLEPFVNLL